MLFLVGPELLPQRPILSLKLLNPARDFRLCCRLHLILCDARGIGKGLDSWAAELLHPVRTLGVHVPIPEGPSTQNSWVSRSKNHSGYGFLGPKTLLLGYSDPQGMETVLRPKRGSSGGRSAGSKNVRVHRPLRGMNIFRTETRLAKPQNV